MNLWNVAITIVAHMSMGTVCAIILRHLRLKIVNLLTIAKYPNNVTNSIACRSIFPLVFIINLHYSTHTHRKCIAKSL